MENQTKIDIPASTILKITLVLLGLWFLYVIRDIAVLFMLVLIVVAAVSPLVDKMAKYIPRVLSVVILALVFLAALVGLGFLIIPPLVMEFKQLAINLPIILAKIGPIYRNLQIYTGTYQEILLKFSSQLGGITNGIYLTTVGFISGIIAFVTFIILSFYLLLERDSFETYLSNFYSEEKKEKVAKIIKKLSEKMSQWLGGHLLLMLVVAIFDGIALASLGVPYVMILAIWGGLMELFPYIGPWLGIIPAVLIAFTVSPLTALLVAIAFIIIQQIESSFLAPKIMGRAVGLSPVIIILALLIGAKLMGFLGMLISVPVAAIISVIISHWVEIKSLMH
jgi:predicted PurR-regulated permease PerM